MTHQAPADHTTRPGSEERPATARGAEKRATRRYVVDEPALVIIGKQGLTCRLCDISFGGAMLEVTLPLQAADHFQLVVLDLPELVCRVAHVGNGYLGVSFINGTDLRHDLAEWIRKRRLTP